MDLQEYFAGTKGNGIISTADEEGIVNAAVYAPPHCLDHGLVAFVMREQRTYENILKNPSACYLFIEQGSMAGKRLYLTKVREEKNDDLVRSICRKCPEAGGDGDILHLVIFRINKILPLVGYEEAS